MSISVMGPHYWLFVWGCFHAMTSQCEHTGRYNMTYLVRNISNDQLPHYARHDGRIWESDEVVSEVHRDQEGVQVVGDGCRQGHHHHGRPSWKQNGDVMTCQSSLWRHQMETVSALLVFCEGISPVTSEFPSQRPMTQRRPFVWGQ